MVCQRCGWQVEKIDFPEEMVLEIKGLVIRDMKIKAVKKMMDEYGVDHAAAKGIISHFNSETGRCHRCGELNLNQAYTTCPKCKAFNYNLPHSSL